MSATRSAEFLQVRKSYPDWMDYAGDASMHAALRGRPSSRQRLIDLRSQSACAPMNTHLRVRRFEKTSRCGEPKRP
jgi:hypothetical protein